MDIKNARLVGGAAAIATAVQNVLPSQGSTFSLPSFDRAGIFSFYLPASVGLAAVFPTVFGLNKNTMKIVVGGGLAVVGGQRILIEGNTAVNTANIIGGYVPLLAGAFLLLKG